MTCTHCSSSAKGGIKGAQHTSSCARHIYARQLSGPDAWRTVCVTRMVMSVLVLSFMTHPSLRFGRLAVPLWFLGDPQLFFAVYLCFTTHDP